MPAPPATGDALGMLDALQGPAAALGPDFEVWYLNDAWRECYGDGFAPGESYLDGEHPALGRGALDRELLEAALGGARGERTSRNDLGGEPRWVVTSAAPLALGGGRAVLVQKRDVTAERRHEQEFARYRGMLESLGFAMEAFLRGPTWREGAQKVIARLGGVMNVSRVYIFNVRNGSQGRPLYYQLHEWVAPGIKPEIDNPAMQGGDFTEAGVSAAREALSRNLTYGGIVAEMAEPEREFFEAQSIKSFIVVPIFVEGAWWGFVGFDECRSARAFTAAEIEGLRAAAGLLGSAIQHQRLREAETQRAAQQEILRAQEAALLELSTPLLPVREDVLVMPLVGSLDAKRAGRVLEVVLQGVAERRARVAIIDITGVPAIDSVVADAIVRVAKGVRLLGAQVILTGIGPRVARTLVELGADLGEMATASSLQTAMALATKATGAL